MWLNVQEQPLHVVSTNHPVDCFPGFLGGNYIAFINLTIVKKVFDVR